MCLLTILRDTIRYGKLDLRLLPELVTALLVPFLGELVRRGYPLLLHVNQARIVVIAVVLFKVPLVGPWIPIFSVLLQRYRQIAAGVDGITVLVISVVQRRRRRRARRKRRRRAGPAIYQIVFWRIRLFCNFIYCLVIKKKRIWVISLSNECCEHFSPISIRPLLRKLLNQNISSLRIE